MQPGKPSFFFLCVISLSDRFLVRKKALTTVPSFLSDNNSGHAKVILTRVLAASLLGFISTAATTLYYRRKSKAKIDQHIIPGLVRTESGRLGNLERFSDYVGKLI
jgi:hypothetical protein